MDAEDLHCFLLLDEDEDMDEDEEYTRYIAAAAMLAYQSQEESRRIKSERRFLHRTYLTRPDLLPNPREQTPWQILYTGRNDRAYITTMGFDVKSFDLILASGFEIKWDSQPIPRTDVSSTATPRTARRSLDAAGALGLVLHYLSSTMTEISLMEIFALIPSTVSRFINFSLTILLETLQIMGGARVRWPREEEFQEFNEMIVARHPLLTGAFGSMDGLNLPIQTSTDQEIENAMYNGWLHEHFVSSVFAFGADGCIMAAKINAPGSWHDSRVAVHIYEKLRTSTPVGYYLVTDTAFPRGSDQIQGRIRAPIKDGARLPADLQERKQALDFDRQLLSYRQTAEWGNRGTVLFRP